MNRRKFLRAFVGAAVGAAIAPYVPVPAATAQQIPKAAATGGLSYKVIHQAYMEMANPPLRPHMMICSMETYEYLCKRLGVENAFKNRSV